MTFETNLIKSTLIALSLVAGQASAAAPFSPVNQPLGYIGPVELSNSDLSEGVAAFRGWFENGSWQGDLIEYTVSSNGSMTTSIDLTGLQPKQGGSENWSANVVFGDQDSNYWNDERKIILGDGDGQIAFRWSKLDQAQKQAIDAEAESNNAVSSEILDFLRGDRSNEFPTGALRQRFSILGDIIHSNPEYVAVPSGGYFDTSYVNFANTNAGRTPVVYVGANDGMLHAFNAEDGSELWAYVPSMVVDNLSRLAGRPYAHVYYVDGGITIQDAFFETEGAWHSVLAGSLGGGGKGLFLLDVTTPELTSEFATSGNDKKVLWEIDDSDDDIGYIFGETTIAQLNDGRWYAVNGNGVSSKNGIAMLLLIDLETGDVVKISTGEGNNVEPNGLAPPALVDTNNDGKADVAYAGDIDGDLWKFDLTDKVVEYKLYDGLPTQPITVAPDVANHPRSGYQVLFGTGRLYTAADIVDTSTQSLFGIHDDGNGNGGDRVTRVLSEDSDYIGGTHAETVRTFETAANIDWSLYNGWQIDLPPGERMITSPILRGGRLKATISNPDGYSNWLLEATYDQGAYENDSIYDLDRTGTLDEGDQVDNNNSGELGDPEDVPMGWKRETGTMSQVTVARIGQGYDTLFLNYLNPPLVEPTCTGFCEGGLEGGHFDVSTDTTWADGTQSHSHLYDDLYDLTFIDWVSPAKEGLKDIAEAVASPTQEFIVLVANADLSPGITIQVGTAKYNIVEYQEMLHRKLVAWNGVGPLTDDDGNSLILTLNDMDLTNYGDPDYENPESTIRFTMDSRAIINGGLHATGNGCVNQDENVTNDRWRNGSPVVQLVARDHLDTGYINAAVQNKALDMLHVQKPIDLLSEMVLTNGNKVKLKEDINLNGSIDADAPDYEAYGGLVVNGATEFIYEGLIHWHFGGNSCYGDPNWLADLADELGSVPEDLYQSILEQYGFQNFGELIDTLAALEDCKAIKENKGGCKETYQALLTLYELGLLVDATPPPGGGSGGGPLTGLEDLTGEPVVIEGGISEGGLTSGPNFEMGRRTWTDIVSSN